MNEALGKALPNEQTEDVEQRISRHHRRHAKGMQPRNEQELGENQRERPPHIEIRAPAPDAKVLIDGIKRHKCATYAKHLQEWYAVGPLGGKCNKNKFFGYER